MTDQYIRIGRISRYDGMYGVREGLDSNHIDSVIRLDNYRSVLKRFNTDEFEYVSKEEYFAQQVMDA